MVSSKVSSRVNLTNCFGANLSTTVTGAPLKSSARCVAWIHQKSDVFLCFQPGTSMLGSISNFVDDLLLDLRGRVLAV